MSAITGLRSLYQHLSDLPSELRYMIVKNAFPHDPKSGEDTTKILSENLTMVQGSGILELQECWDDWLVARIDYMTQEFLNHIESNKHVSSGSKTHPWTHGSCFIAKAAGILLSKAQEAYAQSPDDADVEEKMIFAIRKSSDAFRLIRRFHIFEDPARFGGYGHNISQVLAQTHWAIINALLDFFDKWGMETEEDHQDYEAYARSVGRQS